MKIFDYLFRLFISNPDWHQNMNRFRLHFFFYNSSFFSINQSINQCEEVFLVLFIQGLSLLTWPLLQLFLSAIITLYFHVSSLLFITSSVSVSVCFVWFGWYSFIQGIPNLHTHLFLLAQAVCVQNNLLSQSRNVHLLRNASKIVARNKICLQAVIHFLMSFLHVIFTVLPTACVGSNHLLVLKNGNSDSCDSCCCSKFIQQNTTELM